MKEVNCLFTEKVEILGEPIIKTTRMVKRWSPKQKRWIIEEVNENIMPCPSCKTEILVRYISGTWWLACCSDECYKIYDQAKKDGKLLELNKYGKAYIRKVNDKKK